MKKYYLHKDFYIIEGGMITENNLKCLTGDCKELTKEEYEYLKQNELILNNILRIELEENKTPIYLIEEYDEATEESKTFYSIEACRYDY